MEGTELKILFNQDKAYLTPDRSMTFEQVDIEHVKEKIFRSPAYWTFRVKNILRTNGKYFVKYYLITLGKQNLQITSFSFLLSSTPWKQ